VATTVLRLGSMIEHRQRERHHALNGSPSDLGVAGAKRESPKVPDGVALKTKRATRGKASKQLQECRANVAPSGGRLRRGHGKIIDQRHDLGQPLEVHRGGMGIW
jgi:hypothetical protein